MPVGGLVRSTRKRNKFTTPFKAKYRRGQNIAIKLKTMDKGPSSMEWSPIRSLIVSISKCSNSRGSEQLFLCNSTRTEWSALPEE